MKNILIIGAGAMGSAFTFPCIDNGNNVILIGSPLENNIVDNLNKKNKFHKALDRSLPKKLKIFRVNKLAEKLNSKTDLIVVAVNSKGIEWAAKQIAKETSENHTTVKSLDENSRKEAIDRLTKLRAKLLSLRAEIK